MIHQRNHFDLLFQAPVPVPVRVCICSNYLDQPFKTNIQSCCPEFDIEHQLNLPLFLYVFSIKFYQYCYNDTCNSEIQNVCKLQINKFTCKTLRLYFAIDTYNLQQMAIHKILCAKMRVPPTGCSPN